MGSRIYRHDRDLKLENILIADTSDLSSVKIADFGLAKVDTTGIITGKVGSYTYMAPEVYLRQEYGKEVDLWSLGVMMYTMFCGGLPFPDDVKCEQRVLYGEPHFRESQWRHVSEQAKDLIKALLVKDPHKRITATQALYHPWLRHHYQAPAVASPTNSSEKKRKFSIMEVDDDSQCQEAEVRRISFKERKLTDEQNKEEQQAEL